MSQPSGQPGVLREEDSGGIWEVLRIAFPLIMVNSGQAVKQICDRMMLAWYNETAVAASFTAGVTAFMFLTVFFGICGYAGTFVAQYTGAGRNDRVGIVIWQAMWISLVAGLLIATMPWFSESIFAFIGHSAEVREGEIEYFDILCLGAIGPLLTSALASFWVGRGKTWTIVVLQLISILANLLTNWWLIFGQDGCHELSRRALEWRLRAGELGAGGFFHSLAAGGADWLEGLLNQSAAWMQVPALGISGAALATVGTDFIGVFFLGGMFFLRRKVRRVYGAWPKRAFDWQLVKRMTRFGFPNGVQFFVDICAFNTFGIIIGLYGVDAHFAATVAFSANSVGIMPIIGMANAVCILVGQSIGAGDIGHAVRSVRSGRAVIVTYTVVTAAALALAPEFFSGLFGRQGADAAAQAGQLAMADNFLKFIAAYLIFDGFFFLYANAIRGAGDTRFAMNAMLALAIGGLIIPSSVAYTFFRGGGPYMLWTLFVLYVIVSGVVFYLRYRTGAWKSMKVIEDAPAARPSGLDAAGLASASSSASGRFQPQ